MRLNRVSPQRPSRLFAGGLPETWCVLIDPIHFLEGSSRRVDVSGVPSFPNMDDRCDKQGVAIQAGLCRSLPVRQSEDLGWDMFSEVSNTLKTLEICICNWFAKLINLYNQNIFYPSIFIFLCALFVEGMSPPNLASLACLACCMMWFASAGWLTTSTSCLFISSQRAFGWNLEVRRERRQQPWWKCLFPQDAVKCCQSLEAKRRTMRIAWFFDHG